MQSICDLLNPYSTEIELPGSIIYCYGNISFCSITCESVDKMRTKIYYFFSPGGGGVLPNKRLILMCRWMGSHFHDWIDYNGVAFSIELLEWGRTFSDFWVRKFVYLRLANVPECLYCR